VRVGLVCPYSLDVPGGVQNHVRDLALQLSSSGHEVCVLAPGEPDDELPAYVEVVGKAIPVPYNGSVARLAFGPRVAARAGRWLRDGAFDVVHLHEPLIPSVSLLALWAAEQPVVATFHTAMPRSRAMSSMAGMLRPSIEKIYARIAVSESARATVVQHLGGEPVVIPNGLFCKEFERAEPLPQWGGPGPTIVFLGRTDEPRKGLAVLLAALPQVLRVLPDARLLIAGSGNADVLDDVPPDVRRSVELLGHVSNHERGQLLASATVYVAPNKGGESFGIVLAEAMAAGAPVAASDLPSFRAVLGDGHLGRLFAAGDAADCATAVVEMCLDEDLRLELARRAAVEVRRYDWSTVAKDVLAVYETVLPPASGARP